jgi:hypothetical protein
VDRYVAIPSPLITHFRILAARTAEEILGLQSQPSPDEAMRAFRRMAAMVSLVLVVFDGKVHPDKNRAPRSDEAFKRLVSCS